MERGEIPGRRPRHPPLVTPAKAGVHYGPSAIAAPGALLHGPYGFPEFTNEVQHLLSK